MSSLQSRGINNSLDAHFLHKHKRLYDFAQSHKGEEYPSTKHLRAELLQLFKVRGHHPAEGLMFSFPLSPAYAPCTTPLEHLTKIMVDNLKLETHHRGQYILLRTLTPTDFLVAVGAVAEAEAGNVIMLQLHNQETEVFARGGFPEGTVLVVVEPYLHVPGVSPCAIRVDHPSDLRVLSDWDIIVPVQWRRQLFGSELGAMQWKAKGNDAFNAGEYRRAIDCYTQALSSSPTPDEATRRSPPLLDRATYVGPVAVRPAQSSGLGLFTITAVKAGDLLVCEKALAYAQVNLHDFSKSLITRVDPERERISPANDIELLRLMTQKLLKTPSLIPGIITLHHGEYESVDVREVDNTPVVDSFLLDRIIAANAFFNDRSSRREEHRQTWGSDGRVAAKKADVVSCGVWPLISRINHSCHSTADIGCCFDRDLDSTPALNFRQWGFRCTCILCNDHEATPADNLHRRRQLLRELGVVLAMLKDGVSDSTKLEEHVINKIASTYVRPAAENTPRRAIEYAVKGFEALGYVVEGALPPYPSGGGGGGRRLRVKKWGVVAEGLVGCWMTFAHSYRKVAPALAPQAQEFAKVTYRIVVGEDETFGEPFAWRADLPDGFLSPER
ncbi:TPR domain protein [Aspergillus brunneoviolaceus CBS 621.78]|uniref:Uncharacterized protein n=1 Tax=Aspergillus brunneoviolaceus CBS 621.78 TaxID=1450534 RepID=A0ACD1GDU1_9EURO|nr:hypothetical protein BO95DRAFT_462126 [Aspergillus brunneoviolaceus CBS 621.78]RAH47421.1 hypothetical protein BO95DRAFT_462126 [Aspergillus brunneoviolaceus CBS 621.78]